jgi:hypothetical protein
LAVAATAAAQGAAPPDPAAQKALPGSAEEAAAPAETKFDDSTSADARLGGPGYFDSRKQGDQDEGKCRPIAVTRTLPVERGGVTTTTSIRGCLRTSLPRRKREHKAVVEKRQGWLEYLESLFGIELDDDEEEDKHPKKSSSCTVSTTSPVGRGGLLVAGCGRGLIDSYRSCLR